MIRYTFKQPGRAANPTEGVVSLDAKYGDQLECLQVDAPSELAARILDALCLVLDDWDGDLDDPTTPDALAAAMGTSELAPFEPMLIEGAEVLSRRQPPLSTPDQLTESLPRHFARHLLGSLTPTLDPMSYQGGILYGDLGERLWEWAHWRPSRATADEAAEVLAARLPKAIEEQARVLQEFISNRPRESRLIGTSISPAEAIALARAIVAAYDAAQLNDPLSLAHDLWTRIASLGLGGQQA
jgi:hypothetical protein